MQHHRSTPWVDLRGWAEANIQLFFSEYGHIAYQIQLNHECSNAAANILPADPLTLPADTLG